MRKQGILFVLVMMLLCTTGCWDREEVNDIAIVTAAGVDKMKDGSIRVALQLALPRLMGPSGLGGGGGGDIEAKSTWVVSEKGETIVDAYRRIQMKLPRKIFFAHNRIIIIGEKMARHGVAPLLDFFTRDRESRLGSYILFTKGEAMDILQFAPKFEEIGAEVIREEEKLNIMVAKTLRDFLSINLRKDEEPIASQINITPSEVRNNSQDPDSRSQKKLDKNLNVNGVAVFHKDKLIGWMNDKEGRGLLWLRNEMKTSIITVAIPKDKGSGTVSIHIVKAQTKMKPLLQNEQIHIEVEVHSEGNINENTSKLDLSNPKTISYIQNRVEKEVKTKMQLALDKAQTQFKSDIIGVGRSVHRAYPTYWNNELKQQWDQTFPKLSVKITPHVKITHTGLNTKSFSWEEDEFKQ